MTSVWVAEHGWVYLNAIIDCCTREIVGWQLSLRCRPRWRGAVRWSGRRWWARRLAGLVARSSGVPLAQGTSDGIAGGSVRARDRRSHAGLRYV